MKKSLLDIVSETNNLVQNIIENGGEIDQDAMNLMDVNKNELALKADNYAHIWERLEMEESYWSLKAKEMSAVSKACKNARENLKTRLKYAMKTIDNKELSGQNYRFKLSSTAGRLVISDAAAVPEDYKYEVISKEIDKDKLKEALKGGVVVPGASIISEPSLRKYIKKGE